MSQLDRRTLLQAGASAALTLVAPTLASADDMTGISASEIRIGSTTSLSGPVSALGVLTRCQEAFFKMVNEQGGVAGRKINYIYYDDGFQPPKTVEQVRRLIENDEVAFLFSMLGTAPNSAVVKYINAKKVPHLFLAVNGDKWGDYKLYPWTMPFAPSARIESQIYTKYALQQNPNAKFAILYQNDDLGKDYVAGVRDVLGAEFDSRAKAIAHEVTDPTVNSQIVSLQATGADVLISGSTAKFVAQSIRAVSDIRWKAMHFIATGATSIAGVINPAGPERAAGIISSAYVKDPSDPEWAKDKGVTDYLAFMQKYFPEGKPEDFYNIYGYTVTLALMQIFKQCGDKLSRENIMRQAENLKDLEIPTIVPGIKVDTSPTNHHPVRQVQLQRWDGTGWKRFGGIIEGANL
jgi:branched-chain amino acid transport system substrate-binding protein